MPAFNQVEFIEESCRSVLDQDYDSLELIVVDGLSSDGTQDVLISLQLEYGNKLKWISEKDSGPAEAINKAILMSSGSLIGWLNSDDLYTKGAVRRAVNYLSRRPHYQIIYGLAKHINQNGRILEAYPTKPPSTNVEKFKDGCFICQPTVFMRRQAVIEIGLLDEKIKTGFDFDLWIRFFKKCYGQIGFIRSIQAYSRLHPNCLTIKQRQQVSLDAMKLLFDHFEIVPEHWFFTHIDELLSNHHFAKNSLSIINQIETYLSQASKYYSSEIIYKFLERLKKDCRITLSKPGINLSVQPDGWVGKNLVVQHQSAEKAYSFIVLHCTTNWPILKNIKIRITTSNGKKYEHTIRSNEDFDLHLEILNPRVHCMHSWIIEASQSFIPAKNNPRLKDNRRLSFLVKDISFLN